MTLQSVYGQVKDRYLELIQQFPLRPLRDDRELAAATDLIHQLVDQDALSEPEQDYLDVLSQLVEQYETKTIPMRPLTDADMLRSFVDSHRLSQAEIARQTGIAESTIASVIAGKRQLSRKHIGKLAGYFGVSPALFSFER